MGNIRSRLIYIFRLRKTYFILLLAAVFFFLCLEILILLFWPNYRPISEPCEMLGFCFKPASSATDYSTLLGEHRIVQYFIGANGERAHEPGYVQQKKRPLILCIGDSNTFGQGIEHHETYPFLLADEIGHPVTIMNFGVAGYNGDQVCANSLLKIREHHPDLAIIQFCANDDQPPLPVERIQSHRIFSSTRSGVFLFLLLDYLAPPPRASFNRMTASRISETLTLLREMDMPVILLFHSKPPSVNKRFLNVESQNEATIVVDVEPFWRSPNLLKSSGHFNKKGNAIVARELADVIRSQVLLVQENIRLPYDLKTHK